MQGQVLDGAAHRLQLHSSIQRIAKLREPAAQSLLFFRMFDSGNQHRHVRVNIRRSVMQNTRSVNIWFHVRQ